MASRQVPCICFSNPLEITPGTVIALLNPNIQVSGSQLSLQVDGPEVIMVLGESSDWKRCPGKACKNSVDVRKEKLCPYHVEEQLREARMRRHAVNVNPVGKRNYHAPNLEETAEADSEFLGPLAKLPENKFRGRGSRVVAALKSPAQAAAALEEAAPKLPKQPSEVSKLKQPKRSLALPPAQAAAPLPKKQKTTADQPGDFVDLEESDASE